MKWHRDSEDAAVSAAAPSGQTREPKCGDRTTTLPTLQHRIGNIRLKARVPVACIALQVVGPITAELLTIAEAQQLIGALTELVSDLEADGRARSWSARLLAQADASAPPFEGKL